MNRSTRALASLISALALAGSVSAQQTAGATLAPSDPEGAAGSSRFEGYLFADAAVECVRGSGRYSEPCVVCDLAGQRRVLSAQLAGSE